MEFLMIGVSIVVPILMFFLQRRWNRFRFVFNGLAIISTLVFGNIAARSIYTILKDETVFMTNIHAIFLNPIFLLTGAYLGIYVLYLLILTVE